MTENRKTRWDTVLTRNGVALKTERVTKFEVDVQCSRLFESANHPGKPALIKVISKEDNLEMLVIDDLDVLRYSCNKVKI